MAKRRAAVKRLRADKTRHLKNIIIKRDLKKVLKKFQELITAKNMAEAKTFLAKVSSVLDKAAKKKIIHPNLANRKKSRLARKVLKAA